MFYVWEHHYGRKLIAQGPAQGLLEWPQHQWFWTDRSRAKAAAIEIAKASTTHARVIRGHSGLPEDIIFDNGKEPGIPAGWYPPSAETAMDGRRAAQ